MKLRLVVLLLAIGAGGSITAAQQSAAPRPISVDDFFAYREAHDPQVAPDGQYVAYTVSSSSLKDDKSETRIYMVPAVGGEAIALTAEGASSEHPRWSPDGKFLAFLSERSEGKTQVYLLNRLGGEAQRLTDTIQNVESFEWAPDSKRLVLVLRDPSPEELEAAANKGKEDGEDKAAGASGKKPKTQRPWVIDRLLYKTDTVGYLDRRRTHLYVFDVASKSLSQVSSGDYDDSEPAWSPDGKLLAFTSNRSKPDPDATYNRDIWVVAADNKDKGEHPLQVTTHPGEKDHPSWSPDGKWITYVTSLDPKLFYYATKHVGVSPAEGGEAKILTRSFDRFATLPRFAPDGKSIYFIADDDGTQNLCQVSLADGKITRPVGGRLTVDGYSFSKDGTLAATIADTVHPYEVFALPGGKLTRLSHLNDAWVAQFKLSPGEYVSFKSKDGTTVHGYLFKPVDYVPGKSTRRSSVRMGGQPRNTRRSSSNPRSSLRQTGTSFFIPTREAPRGMARSSARPSLRIGATRTFRTTWPWWITPSRRASRTRTSWGSEATPTAASRRTSSLGRRRDSRPPSPTRARRR